jgi:hypothetical protein
MPRNNRFVQNGYPDREMLAARLHEDLGPAMSKKCAEYVVVLLARYCLEAISDPEYQNSHGFELLWVLQGIVACAEAEGVG